MIPLLFFTKFKLLPPPLTTNRTLQQPVSIAPRQWWSLPNEHTIILFGCVHYLRWVSISPTLGKKNPTTQRNGSPTPPPFPASQLQRNRMMTFHPPTVHPPRSNCVQSTNPQIGKNWKISTQTHTHTHRDFRENWYVNVCNGTMYDHRIHIVWMEGTQPLRFSFPWWRFPLRSIGIVYMRWIVSSESRCYIIVSMFMHIYLWYV